jgi:hypothetical protein
MPALQSLGNATLRSLTARVLGVACVLFCLAPWAWSATPSVVFESYLQDGRLLAATASSAQGNLYLLAPRKETLRGVSQVTGCVVTRLAADGQSQVYRVTTPVSGGTCAALAVDVSGNAYVAATGKGAATTGALQSETKGGNLYLYKLDASGTLVYATYLGGSGSETPAALAVDASGNLLVAGETSSPDLPVKGSGTANLVGKSGGFLASLAASGAELNYLEYLNGATVTSLSATSAKGVVLSGVAGTGFSLKTGLASQQPFLAAFTAAGEVSFVTPLAATLQNVTAAVAPDGSLAVAATVSTDDGDALLPKLLHFTASGSYTGEISLPAATITSGQALHLAADADGLLLAAMGTLTQSSNTVQNSGSGWLLSLTTAGVVNFATPVDSEAGFLTSDGSRRIYLAGDSGSGTPSLFDPLLSTPSAANGSALVLGLRDAVTLQANDTSNYYGWQITPSSLTFNGIPTGSMSNAQTVTVTNNGASSITLDTGSIAITGFSGFAETDDCGLTLVNGKYCSIAVTYTPTGTSDETGTLVITPDSSTGLSAVNIPLKGTTLNTFFIKSQYSSNSLQVTLYAGQTAEWDLKLISDGSIAGTASFDCYDLPAKATCTVTPANPTLTANGTTTFTVKVVTTGSTSGSEDNAKLQPQHRAPVWLAMLGGTSLLGGVLAVGCRRRRALRWLALLLAVAALISFSGCGTDIASATTTPAGGYTVMLDVSVGGITQTAKLTMTVQ